MLRLHVMTGVGPSVCGEEGDLSSICDDQWPSYLYLASVIAVTEISE